MYEDLQWNLSNTDTKKSVLFSKVSYVQGENSSYIFSCSVKKSVFNLRLSKEEFHCVENCYCTFALRITTPLKSTFFAEFQCLYALGVPVSVYTVEYSRGREGGRRDRPGGLT